MSAEHGCQCQYDEIGDGESGPMVSMTPNEECPIHGREAEPEQWAKSDEYERGYVLSSVRQWFRHRHADQELLASDELVMTLFASCVGGFRFDDGHDDDRAISAVVELLADNEDEQ